MSVLELARKLTKLRGSQFTGSDNIPPRLEEIRQYINKLKELADARKARLSGGVDYYQVNLASPRKM